jgi:antirestriction protein ArdC
MPPGAREISQAHSDQVPTVRHANYVGSWLEVLREDNRAVICAASAASKAVDFLLAFRTGAADARIESEEAA